MVAPLITEADRISRAADTLQQAFLDFREASWHSFYSRVIENSKTIILEKDPSKAGRRNGWFARFPEHLVQNENAKKAVLTTLSGHELGLVKHLVDQLFEGMRCIATWR